MFRSFQDVGVPAGYGFKQLLFSPAAKVLVLQTCSASDNWRPERLYFRRIDTEEYRPISVPDDLVSQESPFVHPSQPLLACISNRHKFSVDPEGKERHSGEWHSLEIIDLESGSLVRSVTQESLQLPPGFGRGWICELVAFGDSGCFVKAALSETGTSFGYFIAELEVGGSLKPIAELPAVFM
jgi:hypothetical protein